MIVTTDKSLHRLDVLQVIKKSRMDLLMTSPGINKGIRGG